MRLRNSRCQVVRREWLERVLDIQSGESDRTGQRTDDRTGAKNGGPMMSRRETFISFVGVRAPRVNGRQAVTTLGANEVFSSRPSKIRLALGGLFSWRSRGNWNAEHSGSKHRARAFVVRNIRTVRVARQSRRADHSIRPPPYGTSSSVPSGLWSCIEERKKTGTSE